MPGRATTVGGYAAAALGVVCLLAAILSGAGCGGGPSRDGGEPALPTTGVVRVDGGDIRGSVDGSVSIYRGVPFAAPPVGPLRWRPPQPVRPWEGVRECVSFAPACPQQNVAGLAGRVSGPQSEDCLYLNIWSPAHAPGERLPVMVWIHGGGFVCGTASLPGRQAVSLSAGGRVVLVSVSYRLGIFGYLALSSLSRESADGISGNYGLLDQIAALRWVRRNIAAFGGDPRRVTVFGQSAGGQSVIALLVSPRSRGLFARAVVESARYEDRGIGLWATRPLAAQVREGEAIATGLGAPPGDGRLTALRSLGAARLLAAAAPAARPLPALFSEPPRPSFQPVIDGVVLPAEPQQMLRRGDWARVPVIVGSNGDEAGMWFRGEQPAQWAPSALECRRRAAWYAGRQYARLARWFSPSSNGGLVRSTSRMMTVLEFNAPARDTARWAARSGTRVYLYYFTWAPPGDAWGAVHGAETDYVFGAPPAGLPAGPAHAVEARLAAEMRGYWSRFAATGDPNGPGLPPWPRYGPGRERALEVGAATRAVAVPYLAACRVVDRLTRRAPRRPAP